MTPNDMPPRTRRTVLCGAAALASAGAAGFTLTGCEKREAEPNQQPTEPVDLGAADQVPVGGAQLYRDEKVLVWRAAEDDYRAYSAVCTHAGCVLSALRDDVAVCSCHGSTFDPSSGAVLQGPAEEPLNPMELEIDSADGTMTALPPRETAEG